MLRMEDVMVEETNRGFKDYTTVHDFDDRFRKEGASLTAVDDTKPEETHE